MLARSSTPAGARQARNLKFIAELQAPVQEHNSKPAGGLLAHSWKLPVLWRRVCSYPLVELVLELVWIMELQAQLPNSNLVITPSLFLSMMVITSMLCSDSAKQVTRM